jgi:hypothetical protein
MADTKISALTAVTTPAARGRVWLQSVRHIEESHARPNQLRFGRGSVTGLAGAIGAAIADYFTSTLSLDAASTYEIECHAYFLKTTAGTFLPTVEL